MTSIALPVRVGLVGAGTWARDMHAPMLAAGPETALAAVWARRREAAAEVAGNSGAAVTASFDELLERCDAVDLAVPPRVQAELAPIAARAGKALILEKPLADTLVGARGVAAAVAETGVASILVLTKRFHQRTRSFLQGARELRASGEIWGVDGRFWHGAFLAGPFANGWRLTEGALLDLGPHLIDLADAVAGRIVTVTASGDPLRYVALRCTHADGTVSQLSLSGSVGAPISVTRVDVAGRGGALAWDTVGLDSAEPWPALRAEFAAAVRDGAPVTADAARGLVLAEVVDAAQRSLASGGDAVAVG